MPKAEAATNTNEPEAGLSVVASTIMAAPTRDERTIRMASAKKNVATPPNMPAIKNAAADLAPSHSNRAAKKTMR